MKTPDHSDIDYRARYLFIFVLLIFAIIFGRLVYLQVIKKDFYLNIIESQHSFSKIIEPERGEVFAQDKNGDTYPLAINKDWPLVYVVPKNIKNPSTLADELSPILNLNRDTILTKLEKENDYYEVLAKKISDDVLNALKNLDSPDLYFNKETGRIYPNNNLAANVIGFLGKNDGGQTGQYGIEGFYDSILKGKEGLLSGGKDTKGQWITLGDSDMQPATNGSSLVLTIDKNIQFVAEEKLKEVVDKWSADEGSIIVMDTRTGKILAMADYPSFNPNEYFSVKNYDLFKNHSVQSIFEPGSVFKPIIMAAGLDVGAVTPDTQFYDQGFVKVNGRTIKTFDQKVRGWQNMSQVIEQSLNTGMVFVSQKLDKPVFKSYVDKFGFNKDTGIDLFGEASGDTSNLNKNSDIYYATASFGQGISVTPIQIITAINAIANGGVMMKPYVVDQVIGPDGSVKNTQPIEEGKIIKSETANEVIQMMINAVEKGYEHRGGVDGYLIAGKTGTAQIPNLDKGGYSDKFIHSFVGFGPAYNPKFTAFIKIDNPKGIAFASNSLSPTFGELAKYILSYYNIPPDIK